MPRSEGFGLDYWAAQLFRMHVTPKDPFVGRPDAYEGKTQWRHYDASYRTILEHGKWLDLA